MPELIALLLTAGAALGYGAGVLSGLGTLRSLGAWERWPWAFAIGFGVLGWLLFPMALLGWLSMPALVVFCLLPLPGLLLLGRPGEAPTLDTWGRVLLAGLAVVLALDGVEALAPPSDADSLAYHFALPKLFLAEGRLVFVPRALDGAAPLLAQLTYLPALAIGGERGLTLWTMASGWGTGALLFALCRRHMGFNWSLAVALVYLTVPAVIYGGGAGQVEVRNALFALGGAYAVGLAWKTGDWRYAALAGLAAGFFAGGKYLGLLFVAAAGLTILMQRRWLKHGAAFSVAAVIAGFQWYAWHWAHTGDPVFPMLFTALGLADSELWSGSFDAYFRARTFGGEGGFSANPWTFVAYPFLATLDPPWNFEAGRVGFGPFVWLALPFALAGLWQKRRLILESPLGAVALIVFLFYASWFFTTPLFRLRFLLPVLPLLMLCASVAAVRWAGEGPARRPLAAALMLSIGLQISGAALFSLNSFRYLAGGESRDAYLERTVPRYGVARWLNGNLDGEDRVLHFTRQFNYLLDIPNFFGNPASQMLIDFRRDGMDPARFWRQLKKQGISHIALSDGFHKALGYPFRPLLDAHCLEEIHPPIDVLVFGTRTLSGAKRHAERVNLYALSPKACSFEG